MDLNVTVSEPLPGGAVPSAELEGVSVEEGERTSVQWRGCWGSCFHWVYVGDISPGSQV